MAEESAAERRRRRLLEKGDERMARVMGTYGKNAGDSAQRDGDTFERIERSSVDATSGSSQDVPSSTPPATCPSPHQDASAAGAVRQRKGAAPAAKPALSRATAPSARPLSATPEEGVPDALARAAPARAVTFEAAIIAGAFQTQAVRLAMAAIAAVLAARGHLAAAGVSPLLQLLATNAVITLSAAWLLTQQPERYRGLAYQMSLRSGGMLASAAGLLEGLLGRRLVTTLKAIGTLGWGAYVDSGCYLTIVIALYLHLRGDVMAERQAAADAGADAPS